MPSNPLNVNELIMLTNAGIKIATFTEIREALINRYKFIYGKDIDLSTASADGVYVNDLALIINNILQSVNTMYANLDVESASGIYLDTLCALSNVTRKQATRSSAYLSITYNGSTQISLTPQDMLFIDKSGVEWEADQIYTFIPNKTTTVKVYCSLEGKVEAPAQWITQTIDASLDMTISQPQAASVGNDTETDGELKARRAQSSGATGTTVIESLVGALLNINGIRDAKVFNNNTSTDQTLSDTSTLLGHSVYVVLRLDNDDTVISDETIGSLIYEKLTPGICSCECTDSTNGTPKSYAYIAEVAGVRQTIADQTVYWKQAKAISPKITLTITPYAYFSTDEFDSIANSVMSYANALLINEPISANDLLIQTMYGDPMFKGKPTYTTKAVSASSYSNNITYYNYTSWFVKCSGTVTYNTTTVNISQGIAIISSSIRLKIYNNKVVNTYNNASYPIVDNSVVIGDVTYYIDITDYAKTVNDYLIELEG